jgi:hypothetical protein
MHYVAMVHLHLLLPCCCCLVPCCLLVGMSQQGNDEQGLLIMAQAASPIPTCQHHRADPLPPACPLFR